jgi:hypothetical protein
LLLTSQITQKEIIPGFLLLGTTLPETFFFCLFSSLIVDLMTGKANLKKRMKLWNEGGNAHPLTFTVTNGEVKND